MAALQSDGGERQGMADRKQVAINKNAATRGKKERVAVQY